MKLSSVYEPGQYEADIYKLWEQSGAFKPKANYALSTLDGQSSFSSSSGQKRTGKYADGAIAEETAAGREKSTARPAVLDGKSTGADDAEANDYYSIVMPPPNANANMHIGYELTAVLEDIPSRYHRMTGKATLLLPGADHAGFETQAVYEKHLAKEGKSRFDFSREELYKNIWDFVALNRGNFEQQLRQMGVSCDWSRFTFTLDEKIIKRAYQTFKKMWDEGLIYRGERLVNYCTNHLTGFADIEVEYEDTVTPLYYIKYGPFTLATTRPETKFGDTAVAVHPGDIRYKKWVGQTVEVEGVNGPFQVKVIADEMVDPEFGTGVVKITPAHSFDDWEVARRHNLPAVQVINHDGTMNEKAGRFEGLNVLRAREEIVKIMNEKGLLVKTEADYQNRVGKCYKCGTIIEPMLMKQWFVDMQPLAKKAINELEAGKIKFHPDSKRMQLVNYLKGLRDWNISRQIAWGIPIPAFQNIADENDWIFDERVTEETIVVDGKTYRRDPDVFDTWFSSSSWPYATLNYPNDDFKNFYPLSLMETGGEILYPWVSRMIMLGLYVTGQVPFKEVYIHGYVMAEDGSKMSKSVGNTVDPFPVIEEFGSDALRMGIIAGRSPAVNRGYDPRKVEEGRNFCNKLWNIARFIEAEIGDNHKARFKPLPETAADHWMLSILQHSTEKISQDIENYRFSEAYETLYHTVWDDFANWYLEASKGKANHSVLAYGLETVLKLAHPFAPFVTETIWQTMAWEQGSSLILSSWPNTNLKLDKIKAREFDEIINIVSESREIIANLGLNKPVLGFANAKGVVASNTALITRLGRLGGAEQGNKPTGLSLNKAAETVWLVVDSEMAKNYFDKLTAKQTAAAESVERLKARLSNKSYVQNAPEKLVKETEAQLEEARAKLSQITDELDNFKLS